MNQPRIWRSRDRRWWLSYRDRYGNNRWMTPHSSWQEAVNTLREAYEAGDVRL